MTNEVSVRVTDLVVKPEVEATIQAAGAVVNTFLPGIPSIVALAIGGLYHGYRQVRNRKVNEALVQGVETACAILETTPQGQAADAAFVKWLITHQKESGFFTTVSTLVDRLTANPAATLTAQEIVKRVQRRNRSRRRRRGVRGWQAKGKPGGKGAAPPRKRTRAGFASGPVLENKFFAHRRCAADHASLHTVTAFCVSPTRTP